MERKGSIAGGELAPLGRFELERQTKNITIKLDSPVHVGDKLDYVTQLYWHIGASQFQNIRVRSHLF